MSLVGLAANAFLELWKKNQGVSSAGYRGGTGYVNPVSFGNVPHGSSPLNVGAPSIYDTSGINFSGIKPHIGTMQYTGPMYSGFKNVGAKAFNNQVYYRNPFGIRINKRRRRRYKYKY